MPSTRSTKQKRNEQRKTILVVIHRVTSLIILINYLSETSSRIQIFQFIFFRVCFLLSHRGVELNVMSQLIASWDWKFLRWVKEIFFVTGLSSKIVLQPWPKREEIKTWKEKKNFFELLHKNCLAEFIALLIKRLRIVACLSSLSSAHAIHSLMNIHVFFVDI